MAFTAFAQSIRERGKGAEVSLTILRGEAVKEIKATLGPVPPTALRNVTGGLQLYRTGVRRLDRWWFDEFHRPPDVERGPLVAPEFEPISGDD